MGDDCSQLEKLLQYRANVTFMERGILIPMALADGVNALDVIEFQVRDYESRFLGPKSEYKIINRSALHVWKCEDCFDRYLQWLLNLYASILNADKSPQKNSTRILREIKELDFVGIL